MKIDRSKYPRGKADARARLDALTAVVTEMIKIAVANDASLRPRLIQALEGAEADLAELEMFSEAKALFDFTSDLRQHV